MQIGGQDGVKGTRHKEACVLRIGLMHVYHAMYFYDFLSFVIYVFSLDKLGDLLMHLSLSVIHCISAEPLYVCETVGVWIGKWLPNQATIDDTTLHTGFIKKGSSQDI